MRERSHSGLRRKRDSWRVILAGSELFQRLHVDQRRNSIFRSSLVAALQSIPELLRGLHVLATRAQAFGTILGGVGDAFDLAKEDPRTLSRTSRDFLKKDARFCLEVGRLAIQRILEGYGYELTGIDVLEAFDHYMAAAQTLGIASQARPDVLALRVPDPGPR